VEPANTGLFSEEVGNRLMAGRSPDPDQGRVAFLVEVCDPSEDDAFAYTVNDVLVSDFYTPHYFDPVKQVGVQYSFNGHLTEPRQVLRGGYLSWHDPVTDHWFQLRFFGAEPEFRDLGVLARQDRSLRELIDALTPETTRLSTLASSSPQLADAITAAGSSDAASAARAGLLRERIGELVQSQQS